MTCEYYHLKVKSSLTCITSKILRNMASLSRAYHVSGSWEKLRINHQHRYTKRPYCHVYIARPFFLIVPQRREAVVKLVKVSDVSRKPFCFRFVFSYYSLFFILYSLFFIFLLYFPHHCPSITSSIFNRLTSNFQQVFRINRLLLLLNFNEIGPGVGTGRGLQIWYSL